MPDAHRVGSTVESLRLNTSTPAGPNPRNVGDLRSWPAFGFYGQVVKGGRGSLPPSASSRTPGHFRPVVRDGPDLDHVRQRVAGVARLTTASARRPLNALSRPVRGCPEFPGHPLQRGTGCSRCTSSDGVTDRDPTPSAPVPGITGTPGFYGQVVKGVGVRYPLQLAGAPGFPDSVGVAPHDKGRT